MTTILDDVRRFGDLSEEQKVLIQATNDYADLCERRRELEAAGQDATAVRLEALAVWGKVQDARLQVVKDKAGAIMARLGGAK
jgi:hypothetical protein